MTITADNYMDIDFSKVETGEALADLLTQAFGGVDNTIILLDVFSELLEDNVSLQDPKQAWIRELLENINNIEAHLLKGTKPGGPDAFREIYEILEVYGEDDNFGIEDIFETFIDGIEIYNFVYANNTLFCTLNKTHAEMNAIIGNYFGFDAIDENCQLAKKTLQRDWKARTKPLVDNELFIDFND